ncbi:MAG: hypothetical protein ABIZ70_01340 [Gemmatimonadales bacterium]
MDERRLDELLAEATRTYRVPPAPPLDEIWRRVEAEAFVDAPVRSIRSAKGWRSTQWLGFSGAIAAALLVGVFIGRRSAPTPAASQFAVSNPAASATPSVPSTDPYQRATDELLGRSAVLLASLPQDGGHSDADLRFAEQGSQLLTTTRLLLDSPVGGEARMRTLLEDLELVLVQVARIRTQHHQDDLLLIHDALDQNDIVPRIRSAVARNAQRFN